MRRSSDCIIAWLAAPIRSRSRLNLQIQLDELMIHQQDARRPLGLSRMIDPERLRSVLDHLVTRVGSANVATGARGRAHGLRLVTTDLAWTHGTGPEVRGPGEAILMAINGRTHAFAELDGPGLPALSLKSKTI